MADTKDKKEKKMPNLYKVTTVNAPGAVDPYEVTIYAGMNVKQARKVYHQTDPLDPITHVRFYCLDITSLDEDDPGTFSSTPDHQKPPAE